MGQSLIIETAKIAIVVYLLVLAAGALAGQHRALLAYPFRLAYDAIRFILLVLSFGRVRLAPLVRGARRRQVRRIRKWRFFLNEMVRTRQEEKALSQGKSLESVEWISPEDKK